MKLNDFEKGWVAGVIDSEGWLIFTKGFHKDGKGNTYSPVLGISTTSKEFMFNFQKIIGGKGKIQIKTQNGNRKTQYRLVIKKQADLLEVLDEIKNYLIIKNKQAELLLKFLKSRLELGNFRKQMCYTEEELAAIKQVKKLNKKGIK